MLAHAQNANLANTIQTTISAFMSSIIAGLNLLMWVVFLFLTVLLDPDFIFNTDGDFLTMLNKIWILARDLVNIAFALMLIGTAIYTIVTAKKDFVVEHLTKFVLAVILVNFSWFIPRVIIDVGNVAAATVYGIPSLITSQGSAAACKFPSSKDVPGMKCTKIQDGKYTCDCAMVVDAVFFIDAKDRNKYKPSEGWYCPLGEVLCVQTQTLDVSTVAGHSAVLNGLIVNHARLQSLATVPVAAGGQSDIRATVFFMLQQIVVLVIHIALFFPLAAIMVAFAIRIPVLWLTISFMPFVVLKFIVPSQYTGDIPEKIWDHFLKAAFLPAIVGVPLTVGFILVNVGSNMVTKAVNLNGLKTVTIRLTDGISDFWELLWLIMTLGVIWVGVFAALEKMGIMGKGSQAIKATGESLGRLAIKAPLSIPFLPGPGGKPQSLRQVGQTLNPRLLEGALDRTGNLTDALREIRSGRQNAIDSSNAMADRFRNNTNTPELQTLNTQLRDLAAAMRINDIAGKTRIIEQFRNNYNLQIDANNPDAALRPFLERLQRNGANGAEATEAERHINAIRDAT